MTFNNKHIAGNGLSCQNTQKRGITFEQKYIIQAKLNLKRCITPVSNFIC